MLRRWWHRRLTVDTTAPRRAFSREAQIFAFAAYLAGLNQLRLRRRPARPIAALR